MENTEGNKSYVNDFKKRFDTMKNFTMKKAILTIKKTAENTQNAVTNVSNKVMNKVTTTITEEQIKEF